MRTTCPTRSTTARTNQAATIVTSFEACYGRPEPTAPRPAGRYWLPGMHLAAGETPTWPPGHR